MTVSTSSTRRSTSSTRTSRRLPGAQRETADGTPRQAGFRDIFGAVAALKKAGFGFGQRGATPGQFYQFDDVRKRTPNDRFLNTSKPA